jgi:hypothetical protein
MHINELTNEKRQQLINTRDRYESWRNVRRDARRRYVGTMGWRGEYLTHRISQSEKSLGKRSPRTEAIYDAFVKGQAQNEEHLDGLTKRLDEMAPVNQAMRLGRLSHTASRILRACDDHDLLGEHLIVVGTNALLVYEMAAGVQVQGDLLATEDLDFLYDARRHMSFLVTQQLNNHGFVGILQEADPSFVPVRPRWFRAHNRDGYLVDLIRPELKDIFKDKLPPALTELSEDLEAAAIFGLAWLISSPKMEQVVIDEKGYPVRMVAIDPRAFALHKAWLSTKGDRDHLKRRRDMEQAEAAAHIAVKYLQLPFDDQVLSAFPKQLRAQAAMICKN